MPPRTVISPKKKRSKRKGSDASKAGFPKKTRAADVAEVPGAVPLVSLGLTAAEVGDNAPWSSGRPNAGTEVNPQAPEPHRKGRKKSLKEVPPPYSSHLDTHPDVPAMDIVHTGPSFTSQQPGGRFGFATPSTTEIAHSDTTELNLQASNDPYVAIRTKVIEQRAPDAIAEQRARDAIAEQRARDAIAEQQARDAIAEQRARDTITEQRARDAIAERMLSLKVQYCQALHQEDDAVRAQYRLRLLGSEEHSDSKGSSSSDDSDDSDDEDADEEDDGKDEEEGDNNNTVKGLQDFGFLEDALPSQPAVARALTPEFEFQYSHDEDDVIAQMSLDKTSWNKSSKGPPDGSPGLQGQRSQHMETITSKPDDVLQCHLKKNGKPRLPEPESLKLLDQKSFLEDAKAECCAQHALENLFPTLVKNLPGTITEVLVAVLVMWDTNGKQFEAGKGLARAKIQYDSVVPVQERAAWIEHAAAELIKGSFFLRFGVDEQDAGDLPHGIAAFMFGFGCCSGNFLSFTNIFNCVLDGLVKNGHGKSYPNFSMKDYGPIYRRMLELLKCILEDAYHGPRLLAQLQEWAAAGWQGS
ncbi:uncharacterized protein HD556DRAFT_1313638 [Suillus plorans]|uniref:Uncharacterized protein n=1 Tax=Suillus plorans TaxID=116603 RepID=A0A9P7DBK0_9AGAM|nr:uncharacterized protein HD556DRAFT_1313638 [Suillus plorans]KAG1786189.1 hypothetical protein HD556DRAFT_1313638 [Suillus plorans]